MDLLTAYIGTVTWVTWFGSGKKRLWSNVKLFPYPYDASPWLVNALLLARVLIRQHMLTMTAYQLNRALFARLAHVLIRQHMFNVTVYLLNRALFARSSFSSSFLFMLPPY